MHYLSYLPRAKYSNTLFVIAGVLGWRKALSGLVKMCFEMHPMCAECAGERRVLRCTFIFRARLAFAGFCYFDLSRRIILRRAGKSVPIVCQPESIPHAADVLLTDDHNRGDQKDSHACADR